MSGDRAAAGPPMTRPPVLYTDDPRGLLADIRDHIQGQRNMWDGARLRSETFLEKLPPESHRRIQVLGNIRECRDELTQLDRLLDVLGVIDAALAEHRRCPK